MKPTHTAQSTELQFNFFFFNRQATKLTVNHRSNGCRLTSLAWCLVSPGVKSEVHHKNRDVFLGRSARRIICLFCLSLLLGFLYYGERFCIGVWFYPVSKGIGPQKQGKRDIIDHSSFRWPRYPCYSLSVFLETLCWS